MSAADVAAAVLDPELPQLTLADLGILRDVRTDGEKVVVSITPTYSGCPAMTEIRVDLSRQLHAAGYPDVEIRTELDPPWSTDWITDAGRRKLLAAGIAPPSGSAPKRVTLSIGTRRPDVACPRCGSPRTAGLSRFGATACRALYRCTDCAEPFDYVKAI